MNYNQRAFWWVNHKQTFNAEIEGGYIWSPKINKGGGFNQTYQNLTLVRPGDVVTSYANGLVKAIGVVTAQAQEQGKPQEFGANVGQNWSESEGWLVPVEWTIIQTPISPKDHLEKIAPLLPTKHSPLQLNGNGNQGCYLASISLELGNFIQSLARYSSAEATDRVNLLTEQIAEELIEQEIALSGRQPTEKEQLIRARQGQGIFRQRVINIEKCCRVTCVDDLRFLVASHIKPWKDANDHERLDGENGLLLAPHVDKLFDKGWISFADDGSMLVRKDAATILTAWQIDASINVGTFTAGQNLYLKHHRDQVFFQSREPG